MTGLPILSLVCIVISGTDGTSNCCHKKKVGNVTYVLVEKGDTTAYNCMDHCVYEDKGNPGSRFCFKTGEQPAACIREYGCKCGIKKNNRIIGGQETEPKKYPWTALVTSIYGGMCGGSLIASEWILTAAHCLDNPLIKRNASEVRILLGLHQLHMDEATKIVNVTHIIKHPYWNKTIRYDNDFALLRLAEPVDLYTYTPVCLPDFGQDFTGYTALAVGWGANATAPIPGSNKVALTIPGILKEKEMEIVNNNECSRYAWDDENQTFTNGMICANSSSPTGAGNGGVCSGDSGGPLTVDVGGQHTLVGVTSFGPRTCEKVGAFGYFGNVAFFRNWIDASISSFGKATFCDV